MAEEYTPSPELARTLLASFRKKGMTTFEYEWNGTRYPEIIKFPDGSERKICLMGHSVIAFEDKVLALYERLSEDPEKPQRIRVGYLPEAKIPILLEQLQNQKSQNVRIPPKVRPVLKDIST